MSDQKIDLEILVGQPAALLLRRAAELPNLADPKTAERLLESDRVIREHMAKLLSKNE